MQILEQLVQDIHNYMGLLNKELKDQVLTESSKIRLT